MKYRGIIEIAIAFALALTSQLVSAGSVADTYSTGDILTAEKMDNIKAAVNDNNSDISSNTSNITINDGRISNVTTQIQNLATGCVSG